MGRAKAGRWGDAPWHLSENTILFLQPAGGWIETWSLGLCGCSQAQGWGGGCFILQQSLVSVLCRCRGLGQASCPVDSMVNARPTCKQITRQPDKGYKERPLCGAGGGDGVLGHRVGAETPAGRTKRVKEGFVMEVMLT